MAALAGKVCWKVGAYVGVGGRFGPHQKLLQSRHLANDAAVNATILPIVKTSFVSSSERL